MAEQRQPNYSGKCRNIDPAEAEKRRAAGEPAAIRLRIPEHPIRFHDIVRGDVEFSNEVVSDPIIVRSSGMPIYNYVVVIDDADMKITHVIRGDDHISNTPKQVAVYEALGCRCRSSRIFPRSWARTARDCPSAMAQHRWLVFAKWVFCRRR